ncbi:MAG: hypothetical protein ACK57O_13745 [Planctomyces sp.]
MTHGLRFPLLILLLLSGCSRSQRDSADTTTNSAKATADEHAGHDHAAEGPHHGMLMEMGDGELHAELVHGRDWATVYILDATATSACPIDRPQIQVNVTSGNKGRQFSLTASPEKNERAGSSSRFVSADRQLVEALTDTDCKCRIAVLHAGIPYGAAVPQKGEYAHQH